MVSEVKTVSQYESFFDSGIKKNHQFPRIYEINKNLSYSISYIEYLTYKIREEENYVIKSQLYKSYIITGMSIVECVLHYLIKTKGLNKFIYYKEISKIKSNPKQILGKEIKVETIISEKLDIPEEEEMNLDKMIKIAESKKILGECQQETYSRLVRLRKLRNKVHIHNSDYLEHDFNIFKMREAVFMKEILKIIIFSDVFDDYTDKELLFNYF